MVSTERALDGINRKKKITDEDKWVLYSVRAKFSGLETICHSKKYSNLLCKWCLKVHYSGIQTLDTSILESYNFLQLEPNSKIQKDSKFAKFIFSNLKFNLRPFALFCSIFWLSIQTPFWAVFSCLRFFLRVIIGSYNLLKGILKSAFIFTHHIKKSHRLDMLPLRYSKLRFFDFYLWTFKYL